MLRLPWLLLVTACTAGTACTDGFALDAGPVLDAAILDAPRVTAGCEVTLVGDVNLSAPCAALATHPSSGARTTMGVSAVPGPDVTSLVVTAVSAGLPMVRTYRPADWERITIVARTSAGDFTASFGGTASETGVIGAFRVTGVEGAGPGLWVLHGTFTATLAGALGGQVVLDAEF